MLCKMWVQCECYKVTSVITVLKIVPNNFIFIFIPIVCKKKNNNVNNLI